MGENQQLEEAMKLFKKRDFKGALEVFKTMLEADAKNAHLLNNIGLCHAHAGQNSIAEEYYKKALFINDEPAEIYINLADIYYKENRLWEAIELLQQGVGRLPDNAALRHYLGRIYIEDKRYEEAIDALDSVLELSPKNYDANWDLGMVYFELGDWNSAIANFEEVLEYVQDNELIFYQTALAYEANNETDKAISNYLKSISIF
jgi:superkiller protein 3